MSSADTTHSSVSADDFSEVSESTVSDAETQTNASFKDVPPIQTEYSQAMGERIRQQGERYAWLGILAKNATFTAKTAAILWQISSDEAEALLQAWVKQQLLVIPISQNGRKPLNQIYQLPAPLHPVTYQYLTESWNLSGQEAHAIVIERYQAQTQKRLWHTLTDDGYIHAYLTWHLQGANLCDEIHLLLQEESVSGANGWYEACDRKGYTTFFCRDLKLAWRLAEEMYEQAPSQAIQLQCRYALMTVAHNHAIKYTPASLVAAFVNKQVWTPTQSVAYLELIQDPQYLYEVLQDLIPELPSTYHTYLLQIIRHQPHDHQVQLLSILAPLLAPTLAPDLIQIIQDIEADFYQALILRDVAATLPLEVFEQVIDLSQALPCTAAMVAGYGIVTRWPQTVPIYLQLLGQATEIEDVEESVYADLLIAIIPAISDYYLSPVLALINPVQESSIKADLLIRLLPQHPQLLTRAFQTVCTIADEPSCAITLGKISPYLSDVDLQLALTIIEQFEDKAACLLAIGPISRHHLLPRVYTKLLQIIDTLPSERQQGQAIRAVFANLSPAAQTDLKARVSTFTNKQAQALTWSHLAVTDKSVMSAALHAISQCQDNRIQFESYWILGQHWPKLIPAALQAIGEMEGTASKILAIQQVAPHLSDAQLTGIMTLAQRTQNQDNRWQILETIIPYCSQVLLKEILDLRKQEQEGDAYISTLSQLNAQPSSSSPQSSPWEARTLALRSLTLLLSDKMLNQTLSATFEFEDKKACAQSLSQLLPQIHAAEMEHSLWCRVLHMLVHLDQDKFLANMPRLMPVMSQLAGPELHPGIMQTLQMIHRQWT